MSKTVIKVSVNDQALALITRPVVSSGGINENVIQFYFDESWHGYEKEAYFEKEGIEPLRTVVVDNVAPVPDEMIIEDGTFLFGVIGYKDIEKTTELISFTVVNGAIVDSDADLIPTPTVHAQILKLSTDAVKIAKETRAEFESGVVPAFRDFNDGSPFRVWTGTLKDYLAQKDSFPDGVLSVITDQNAEYIVSISDAENSGQIIKYSGGTAEAIFYKTVNISLTDTYGNFFVSPLFNLSFPEYITSQATSTPTSCVINVVGTSDQSMVAFIACSGTWTDTHTQTFRIFSNLSNATGGITLEFRIRYNTSTGE